MNTARPLLPLGAALLVAGCGGGGGSSQTMAQSSSPPATPSAKAGAPVRSGTVTIKSFDYNPKTVVVTKGSRLKWANDDNASHTATADDRSFDTQTIDIGKSRTVTFTRAGTFSYHCDFHPFMKGTVTVR
jgi:plastocyanin